MFSLGKYVTTVSNSNRAVKLLMDTVSLLEQTIILATVFTKLYSLILPNRTINERHKDNLSNTVNIK